MKKDKILESEESIIIESGDVQDLNKVFGIRIPYRYIWDYWDLINKGIKVENINSFVKEMRDWFPISICKSFTSNCKD